MLIWKLVCGPRRDAQSSTAGSGAGAYNRKDWELKVVVFGAAIIAARRVGFAKFGVALLKVAPDQGHLIPRKRCR